MEFTGIRYFLELRHNPMEGRRHGRYSLQRKNREAEKANNFSTFLESVTGRVQLGLQSTDSVS